MSVQLTIIARTSIRNKRLYW